MKTAKIIPIENYREGRQPREVDSSSAGLQLPSADRLWEMLDRNINISVWREHNCAG